MLPNLPPWSLVYQQMQRWLKAGCFEEMVHDLRVLLRLADGRKARQSAAIIRRPHHSVRPAAQAQATMAPSVKRASKVHMAVDTLGRFTGLHVTPADEQDRPPGGQS